MLYLHHIQSYIKDSNAYQKISFHVNSVITSIARKEILHVGAKWAGCGMVVGLLIGVMVIHRKAKKKEEKNQNFSPSILDISVTLITCSAGFGLWGGISGIINALVQERFFKHNA